MNINYLYLNLSTMTLLCVYSDLCCSSLSSLDQLSDSFSSILFVAPVFVNIVVDCSSDPTNFCYISFIPSCSCGEMLCPLPVEIIYFNGWNLCIFMEQRQMLSMSRL
eukprot:443485_1